MLDLLFTVVSVSWIESSSFRWDTRDSSLRQTHTLCCPYRQLSGNPLPTRKTSSSNSPLKNVLLVSTSSSLCTVYTYTLTTGLVYQTIHSPVFLPDHSVFVNSDPSRRVLGRFWLFVQSLGVWRSLLLPMLLYLRDWVSKTVLTQNADPFRSSFWNTEESGRGERKTCKRNVTFTSVVSIPSFRVRSHLVLSNKWHYFWVRSVPPSVGS